MGVKGLASPHWMGGYTYIYIHIYIYTSIAVRRGSKGASVKAEKGDEAEAEETQDVGKHCFSPWDPNR